MTSLGIDFLFNMLFFFVVFLRNQNMDKIDSISNEIYQFYSCFSFLEVLNENTNKIDSISNEIYILGDFNIDLSLNDSYIFSKKKKKHVK